jgi:hypothetical protein
MQTIIEAIMAAASDDQLLEASLDRIEREPETAWQCARVASRIWPPPGNAEKIAAKRELVRRVQS